MKTKDGLVIFNTRLVLVNAALCNFLEPGKRARWTIKNRGQQCSCDSDAEATGELWAWCMHSDQQMHHATRNNVQCATYPRCDHVTLLCMRLSRIRFYSCYCGSFFSLMSSALYVMIPSRDCLFSIGCNANHIPFRLKIGMNSNKCLYEYNCYLTHFICLPLLRD